MKLFVANQVAVGTLSVVCIRPAICEGEIIRWRQQHSFLKLFSGSQCMRLNQSFLFRYRGLLPHFKYLQNKDIYPRQLLKSLFNKATDYHRGSAISVKLITSSQCKCQKHIAGASQFVSSSWWCVTGRNKSSECSSTSSFLRTGGINFAAINMQFPNWTQV